MGCNCGKQRVISPEQAAAGIRPDTPVAKFTVTAPDGKTQDFDRYIDAAIHRRQVNGSITTTSA